MVSNAQIPLNELNKFRGMLVRNLFGKEKKKKKKKEINAKEKEKSLRENEEIEYPKQRKSNIINNIILYLK
jgi:hypothetical protein